MRPITSQSESAMRDSAGAHVTGPNLHCLVFIAQLSEFLIDRGFPTHVPSTWASHPLVVPWVVHLVASWCCTVIWRDGFLDLHNVIRAYSVMSILYVGHRTRH